MLEHYHTLQSLEALTDEAWALVYKHSPTCGISRRAEGEVMQYLLDPDAVPVYKVDVLRQRPLSRALAAHWSVRHASPQIILLHRGRPVWHDSHFAVTAAAIAQQVAAARAEA